MPFTVRSPARGPFVVGVNETLKPQEPPFGTPGALPGEVMTGHVVFCVKSPLAWMLVIWKAVTPVLFKVTGCGLLVTPTGCGEKTRLLGEIAAAEVFPTSYAPRSTIATPSLLPSTMRGLPSKSVVGRFGVVLSPASIAEDPSLR